MDRTKVECPKCFGTGVPMEANEDKGFYYKPCKLCRGEKVVPQEIHDDFLLSLNEDSIEFFEEE